MTPGRFLSLVLVCAAASLRADGGTSSAAFLKMGMGARGAAMGDAQTAAADDAAGLFRNPAALTLVPAMSLTAFHAPYIEDTSFGSVAYAHNLGRRGVFSLGLQYAAAGSAARTDDLGDPLGTVAPRDQALTGGYAFRLHGLRRARFLNGYSLGGSVKQVTSRVVDSARTITADAGVLSKDYLHHRLRWGASVGQIAGRLTFGGAPEPLPREFRLGASCRLFRSWGLSLDLGSPRDEDVYGALGAEYGREVGKKFKTFARLGYSTRRAGAADGLSGMSGGFGVSTKLWSVDYFARFEGNGWMTQGLSLSWGFGARVGPAPHVRLIMDDARRLMEENRFAEAVLKFNEALTEEPANQEAKDGIEAAARNLR